MVKPKRPIRRFDVFAEFNRQQAVAQGVPDDEAKGYGIWLAKVVAARRFGGPNIPETPQSILVREQPHGSESSNGKWRMLSGEPQTDDLFDQEIVDRMGVQFYVEEFVPAIQAARQKGQNYTDIRDAIRKNWKL